MNAHIVAARTAKACRIAQALIDAGQTSDRAARFPESTWALIFDRLGERWNPKTPEATVAAILANMRGAESGRARVEDPFAGLPR